MSHYQAFISLFVFGNLFTRKTTFASFLDDRKIYHCDQDSTLRDTGLLVTHGMPSHYRGVVVIQSKLNRSFFLEDPLCTWSYKVQDLTTVTIVKEEMLNRGSNQTWIFSKSGLRKVSVTAQFDYMGYRRTIKNCTFINVTDCQLTPSVQVSTSNGSYVITKNHTIVTMEFPELINFTVAVIPIDPYFICKRLHLSWYFGDGRNASGNHTEHRYNKAGLYGVVLKIYKVFNSDNGMELMRNVTMTIHVLKDCELTPKVQVSTSKGLYNIIKNHTDVTVDFPGLTNFTVTVFAIDSRYICKHLDFSWSLGDGSNASGKHVEHYYNKTGVYGVVLKIYEICEHDSGKKLMGNVEMNIHVVKEKDSSGSTDTVVDVSLVLAIFFVCFVFVICIAGYCFRKRLHRHTEVARFDFRSTELQSSYSGQDSRLGVNCIPQEFMNKATCRRGSNENLLNFEQRGNYLSCSTFDYVDPDEEL